MNVRLWIVAGVPAVVFALAGAMKLSRTPQQLTASGPGWAEGFDSRPVKAIGVLEVGAAVGLVLPPLVGVAEVPAPVTAVGVVALMIGVALVHGRRHESQTIAANVVLLAPAATVVRDRFGSHAFQSLGPDGTPLRGAADDAPLHAVKKKITGP